MRIGTAVRTHWRGIAVAAGFAAVAFAAGWFTRPIADRAQERRVADSARSRGAAFEIELFARTAAHPAESALCLLDGKYGLTLSGGRPANRGSHVDFNTYMAGAFTAGVQGNEKGQVIDLGDAEALAKRHGRDALESLRWRDGELVVEGDVVLAPDAPGASDPPTPLRRWAAQVLKAPAIADSDKHAQVRPGHLYFVRVAAGRAPAEIAALLQVVEYDVGSRVKLRCVQL